MSDTGESTAAVAVGDGPAGRAEGVSLRVAGLRKSYDDREVVRGVDFEVQAGECFGLLGRNGAGKTTIIEICEGYSSPDAGIVEVLGEDPQSPSPSWRSRLGIVPQDMEVLPTLTVRETVAMFANLYPRPRGVDEVLGLVGLRERAGSRVGKLSGGEKRRLDVAVGLIGDPEIVFLDEPTTGLDPEARREMWAMIEGLKSSGVTIILTTHYMEEAQVLADRLVILAEGVVAARGTFDELLARRGGHATISFRIPEGIVSHTALMPLVDWATIDGSAVEIESRDVQADLGSLLAWAQAAKAELADITVTRDSLEDLFLAIDGPDAHTESQEVSR
jgi:ABC-2 type transport system ATP-binding protein